MWLTIIKFSKWKNMGNINLIEEMHSRDNISMAGAIFEFVVSILLFILGHFLVKHNRKRENLYLKKRLEEDIAKGDQSSKETYELLFKNDGQGKG